MTCRIKLINSIRLLGSSLSRLAANLVEGLDNEKCKDSKFVKYEEVID